MRIHENSEDVPGEILEGNCMGDFSGLNTGEIPEESSVEIPAGALKEILQVTLQDIPEKPMEEVRILEKKNFANTTRNSKRYSGRTAEKNIPAKSLIEIKELR